MAARLDLDDLTHSTDGGLHLATLGGMWQALAWGFLGLSAEESTLGVDPKLPASWDALGLRLRFLGRPIGVRAGHGQVTVSCEAPLDVALAGRPARRVAAPGATFDL